jgi:hypothetical protein
MTPEELFSLLNLMTVAAWIPLVFLPRKRWATTLLPIAVPSVIAVIYAALVIATLMQGASGGFSSLAAVRTLFDNDWGLLAGWAHYLAFDLFIGGWEVRDAQRRGVAPLLVIPALILTFLVGPAGFLVYLAIRWLAPNKPAGALAVE